MVWDFFVVCTSSKFLFLLIYVQSSLPEGVIELLEFKALHLILIHLIARIKINAFKDKPV